MDVHLIVHGPFNHDEVGETLTAVAIDEFALPSMKQLHNETDVSKEKSPEAKNFRRP